MYSMKTVTGLLTVGLMGLTGLLTGCGGGGAGSSQSYSISVRADESSLPANIAGVGPSIGGSYTTTLYVDVKDADGKPIPAGEDNVGCSYESGLDSGPLYYLDGDPEHETTETVNGVEITTPNAYRAVSLSTNAGLATFHFHASSIVGPATIRCTVTDPGGVVRATTATIQVGSNTASGQVSQVVFDTSSPNYLFVQGFNGPTQIQMQANLVDEAGQPITNIPAGANNLQLRIVPDPASLADNDATLRGVNSNGQAVAGASIHIRSINGQAQFTLVSGSSAGAILIEALTDRADNDVGNGITEAVYNYVAVSAVTEAPTQEPVATPLAISSTSLPAAVGGIPYGTLLEATGGSAPYTWSMVTGTTLPFGLSLNPTGVISGTPSGAVDGTFNFVVQLRDAQGTKLQKALSITYSAPPVVAPVPVTPSITASLPATIPQGTYFAQALTASGGQAPFTWSATTSSLPPGLTFNNGVIFGVPTLAGNYNVVVTVTNADGLSSSRNFSMVVSAPGTLTIQTVSLPTGTVGTAYAAQLNAVGGTPASYSWSANQLPAGLVINATTGVISGTPTAAGSFTFIVSVTSAPTTISKDFTLTINP